MAPHLVGATREEKVPGADGKLFVRTWQPIDLARGVVLIVPGFNSHSGHYGWVGEQLSAVGLAVHAVDLRGRGQSDGERFYVQKLGDYVRDVATLAEYARMQNDGVPVFLLGHSAGGVVACLYALEHQSELAGLVCESFAFQVPAPEIALAVLKGLSHVAPHAHVLGLNNADFSRSRKFVQAMDEDPLIANETQPTATVAAMVRADDRLKQSFGQLTLPVLILHGTHDKATRPSGSRFFHEHAGSADKTLKLYEGAYHDLLNDTDRERVMADVSSWMITRLVR